MENLYKKTDQEIDDYVDAVYGNSPEDEIYYLLDEPRIRYVPKATFIKEMKRLLKDLRDKQRQYL